MAENARRYLLGIIGHPVSHSLSPRLHKAALAYHELDGDYRLIDIHPDDLVASIKALREQGFSGLNVTIPHKQAVVCCLNSLDDSVRLIGAVNTISFNGDYACGNNTDIFGFVQSLKDTYGRNQLSEVSAVLLGAGGAARACVTGLCELGVKNIFIHARNSQKAEELVSSFMTASHALESAGEATFLAGRNLEVLRSNSKELNSNLTELNSNLKEVLGTCSLFINATPIGQADPALPDWYCQYLSFLKPDAFVFDLIYSTGKDTATVAKAKTLGLKAGDGTAMLLYQAAQSFKIWTGLDVPLTCLMSALSC